jgi:hypothetical protein
MYRNLVSQVLRAGQFSIDVRVIATFEMQILLQVNGRNLKDGLHVIRLQVSLLLGGLIFYRYL